MNLIFVADPMCSWCYGFAKELTTVSQAFPELPLRIVVGGVRAGETEVMTEEMKQFRLGHWGRVEALSGLPFNREAFLGLTNFVYDTEPICRAVVAARTLAPSMNILPVFRSLQEAFYVHGKDTTDGEVLAAAGARAMTEQGYPTRRESFQSIWADDATIAETRQDFITARQWGIRSFPALLLEVNGQLHSVAPGYMSAHEVERNLRIVLERVGHHFVATA